MNRCCTNPQVALHAPSATRESTSGSLRPLLFIGRLSLPLCTNASHPLPLAHLSRSSRKKERKKVRSASTVSLAILPLCLATCLPALLLLCGKRRVRAPWGAKGRRTTAQEKGRERGADPPLPRAARRRLARRCGPADRRETTERNQHTEARVAFCHQRIRPRMEPRRAARGKRTQKERERRGAGPRGRLTTGRGGERRDTEDRMKEERENRNVKQAAEDGRGRKKTGERKKEKEKAPWPRRGSERRKRGSEEIVMKSKGTGGGQKWGGKQNRSQRRGGGAGEGTRAARASGTGAPRQRN